MDHTICENYYANIGNLVVLTFIEDILYEGHKFLAKSELAISVLQPLNVQYKISRLQYL